MNGGDGPCSYARNSSYQRGAIDAAEALLRKEIHKRLDLTNHSLSCFTIADFGCSSGPNSLLAVDIIIQAIQHKFSFSLPNNTKTLAFQVFFNDLSNTDFNALFALLPLQCPYFVAGVPGSFYGNLFPKASLNLAYSSCALCWLSDLPPELSDTTSPAYNGGRIHYTGASAQVAQAYSSQYKKDINSFLRARSLELAEDGLMPLIVPGVPDGFLDSQAASTGSEFDLIGSCLMDMAREGRIKEEEVDSFNLPIYYTTPKELEDIIISNGEMKIDKIETLVGMDAHDTMPELESRVLYLRAVLEGLICTHFGHHILDELFDRYSLKLAHSSFFLNPKTHKSIMIFALLTRCRYI